MYLTLCLLLIAAVRGEWINAYQQIVIMFAGINIILCSSLNMVNGYMGEFSCGHAGFMAVGAYIASVLNVWLFASSNPVFGQSSFLNYDLSHFPWLASHASLIVFPITLMAGGVAAALVGLLVAIPSFKTRGDYLAIITLAVNYIVKSSVENIQAIGGARGFMGMHRVVETMEEAVDLPWVMIWILVSIGLTIVVINRLVNSTYGKGIAAIRDDEIAAEIMSVDTRRMKLVVFMLSSGCGRYRGWPFRPCSWLHQSRLFYYFEIHRGHGYGLPGRYGIPHRIGPQRHRFYHSDGDPSPLAGDEMGSDTFLL